MGVDFDVEYMYLSKVRVECDLFGMSDTFRLNFPDDGCGDPTDMFEARIPFDAFENGGRGCERVRLLVQRGLNDTDWQIKDFKLRGENCPGGTYQVKRRRSPQPRSSSFPVLLLRRLLHLRPRLLVVLRCLHQPSHQLHHLAKPHS